MTTQPIDDLTLLTSTEVKRAIGNVSDMWLWRRERDDPDWPRPIHIAGRRYWRRTDIAAYIDRCAQRRAAAQPGEAA
jgi:predicted DNA-binding transcriptional regulator AlpA